MGQKTLFNAKPAINPYYYAPDNNGDATIVMADAALTAYVSGRAPMTGITIEQKVDFSINKTLNKDFIVDVFGDSPTYIVIEGFNILAACTNENEGGGESGQVLGIAKGMATFYKENNVGTNKDKRISLSVYYSKEDKRTFQCILVGMRSSVTTEDAKSSILRYRLELVGVAKAEESGGGA